MSLRKHGGELSRNIVEADDFLTRPSEQVDSYDVLALLSTETECLRFLCRHNLG